MYAELFSGSEGDAGRASEKVFEETYDELVLVRDISFNSVCEHHLLPVHGGGPYWLSAQRQGGGLSKLARVVEDISSHRPQVQ